MISPQDFETERLLAEAAAEKHLEDLLLLHEDPEVMKSLGGRCMGREETEGVLKTILDHWAAHDFGLYFFYDKEDHAFVGRAGFRFYIVEGRAEIELLYALRPDYWRKGLGTEMARALLDIGFSRLGFTDVVAFALPTNLASRGIMLKNGMRYERDIIHANLPCMLYRIRRESDADEAVIEAEVAGGEDEGSKA